jgi:hypothetical protein
MFSDEDSDAAEATDSKLGVSDPFDMTVLKEALKDAISNTSRESLEALVQAADNNIGNFMQLLVKGELDQRSSAVLCMAALHRICDATDQSTQAHLQCLG